MADTIEWAGILGFAALFGAFFGFVLSVSVRLGPPVESGVSYLGGDIVVGIVLGVIVFVLLAVAYMFTLARTTVERDQLFPRG